jgi:hypothetical protein
MKKIILLLPLAVMMIQSCQKTDVDGIIVKDKQYVISDSGITTSITDVNGRVFSADLALPRETAAGEVPETSKETILVLGNNANEDKNTHFNMRSVRELSRKQVADQVVVSSTLYEGTLAVMGSHVQFYYTLEEGIVLDREGNSIPMPYPELTSGKLKDLNIKCLKDPTEDDPYYQYDITFDLKIVYGEKIDISTVKTIRVKSPVKIMQNSSGIGISEWEDGGQFWLYAE